MERRANPGGLRVCGGRRSGDDGGGHQVSWDGWGIEVLLLYCNVFLSGQGGIRPAMLKSVGLFTSGRFSLSTLKAKSEDSAQWSAAAGDLSLPACRFQGVFHFQSPIEISESPNIVRKSRNAFAAGTLDNSGGYIRVRLGVLVEFYCWQRPAAVRVFTG